jgi:succinoglycan biosynthesis protein ExoM
VLAGSESIGRTSTPPLPPSVRPMVHVCILTFKRPLGLQRLLAGLGQLKFRGTTAPNVRIVVVDNDAEQSARQTCEDARARLPWPLQYIVEPTRGIAHARNTAVRAVVEQADFVAFIDDDEVPDPLWLDELLRVQRTFAADVVTGPVFPHFDGVVPGYVIRGRFFDPPDRVTGMLLDRAYTGNVVASSRVFRSMATLFDERLGLTGGEDVLFFRRVARAGFKIVWARDAKIDEWVPSSRISLPWILKRAYRAGNTSAICERSLTPSRRHRAWLALRAVGSISKGALALPVSAITAREAAVDSLRKVARGFGYLAGAAGIRYEEYRAVHGG